ERTFATLKESESFCSEEGELVLNGVIEREFRVIYQLLKRMALVSKGESFRKARSPFLAKVWNGNLSLEGDLNAQSFHLPKVNKEGSLVHDSLEAFQTLIPHGFSLHFKGQALQELSDEDFQ